MMNNMNNFSSSMGGMNNMNYSQMQMNGYYNMYNQNISNFGYSNSKDNNSHKESSKYYKNGYNNDDEAKSGKYTCRYEILLDSNDKEFQIARKLIGSKGCNMKRIVEACGGKSENEVKLRLRGQGSGYKEGPYNKESDDPLHLCISSKNYDKYQNACQLVQELINSVFEEYKRFCYKMNKTPLQKIYAKKEEGISRKSTQGNGYYNNNNNYYNEN